MVRIVAKLDFSPHYIIKNDALHSLVGKLSNVFNGVQHMNTPMEMNDSHHHPYTHGSGFSQRNNFGGMGEFV